jgi:quercetin dioxygenase-like cupin family protein
MLDRTPAPQGARLHVMGNFLTFLIRSAEADMGFSLTECETMPGAGTPPHIQADDREAFVVLEGEYEFLLDGETRREGPGAFVRVEKGVVHAFRNIGDRPAKMLILNWPGGKHEGFFEAVGDWLAPGELPEAKAPDMGRIFAAAQAAGITLLPPA